MTPARTTWLYYRGLCKRAILGINIPLATLYSADGIQLNCWRIPILSLLASLHHFYSTMALTTYLNKAGSLDFAFGHTQYQSTIKHIIQSIIATCSNTKN
jgi:hypothetical protein